MKHKKLWILLSLLFSLLVPSNVLFAQQTSKNAGVPFPVSNVVTIYSTVVPGDIAVIGLGEERSFVVGGGSGSYEATSSNPSVATAEMVGRRLFVSGNNAGNATITIYDGEGKSSTFEVTVQTGSFTEWGALNGLECTNGKLLTFSVTIDGTTRSSSTENGQDATFEEFAKASPGKKTVSFRLYGCDSTDIKDTVTISVLEAGKQYVILCALQNGDLAIQIGVVTSNGQTERSGKNEGIEMETLGRYRLDTLDFSELLHVH